MKKRQFETEEEFDQFLKKEKQKKREIAADIWRTIGSVFLFFGFVLSLAMWELWPLISGLSTFSFCMMMWYLAEIRRLLIDLNEK